MFQVFRDSIDKNLFNLYIFEHDETAAAINQAVQQSEKKACSIIWGGIISPDSIKVVKSIKNKNILKRRT